MPVRSAEESARQLIYDKFEELHGHRHRNQHEVELWFDGYSKTEDGKQLVSEVVRIAEPGLTKEESFRRLQRAAAQRILDLFREANKRPARSIKELTDWAASAQGKEWLALGKED